MRDRRRRTCRDAARCWQRLWQRASRCRAQIHQPDRPSAALLSLSRRSVWWLFEPYYTLSGPRPVQPRPPTHARASNYPPMSLTAVLKPGMRLVDSANDLLEGAGARSAHPPRASKVRPSAQRSALSSQPWGSRRPRLTLSCAGSADDAPHPEAAPSPPPTPPTGEHHSGVAPAREFPRSQWGELTTRLVAASTLPFLFLFLPQVRREGGARRHGGRWPRRAPGRGQPRTRQPPAHLLCSPAQLLKNHANLMAGRPEALAGLSWLVSRAADGRCQLGSSSRRRRAL